MARRRRGEAVDGVLLLDKPAGLTSNHALQRALRLLGAAKAGHTGTLDPQATGLLPLTFGEATKFSSDLLDADKGYAATIALGVRTTTGDRDGDVVETRPVAVGEADVRAALARFTGTFEQVPPMHSAIKREGRALYELARAGIEVEREPRRVTVHRFDLVAFDGTNVDVDIDCSKGTYVRVLAEDVGAALGCGAHLAALRRTRVGGFSVDAAVTLDELDAMDLESRRARLLPVDTLIAGLERYDLGAHQARRFAQGQSLDLGGVPGRKRVYGPDGALLGVAELDRNGILVPQRLCRQAAPAGVASPEPR